MAGWKEHVDIEDSRCTLESFIKSENIWAIVCKENNKVIGQLRISPDDNRGRYSAIGGAKYISYALSEDYWGKGYMTEAIKRVIPYLFEELKIEVLTAFYNPYNFRSKRVIEKCGFQYETTIELPEKNVMHSVWSIWKLDYFNKRRNGMTIVLASHNAHKISEIRAILRQEIGEDIELLSLTDIGFQGEIEENGSTFEENACIKAMAAAKLGYISMADDSGLAVDALDGAPGVYSARYAGEPCNDRNNNAKLLEAIKEIPAGARSAKFVSVIACIFPDREKIVVRGECPGEILFDYRGEGGFGYDPLFYYAPFDKTFAQLTKEEKNTVSHRARAMELFTKALREKLKTAEKTN